MVSIVAKFILGEIRKVEGAEESILAGGAVRDAYFNKEPKDYDYFVPSPVWEEVINEIDKNGKGKVLQEQWVNELSKEEKDAYQKNGHLTGVYDVEIEGLRCQIIGHKSGISKEKMVEEEFATEVLKYFDYGVNMIYFDGGAMLRDTEEFQNDVNNGTLTLHNIKSMDHLPGHMEKFLRLRDKLDGEWVFRCPALTLKDDKEEGLHWLGENRKGLIKKSTKRYALNDQLFGGPIGGGMGQAGIAEVAPAGWNVNPQDIVVNWEPEAQVNPNVNHIVEAEDRRVLGELMNAQVGNHIFRN